MVPFQKQYHTFSNSHPISFLTPTPTHPLTHPHTLTHPPPTLTHPPPPPHPHQNTHTASCLARYHSHSHSFKCTLAASGGSYLSNPPTVLVPPPIINNPPLTGGSPEGPLDPAVNRGPGMMEPPLTKPGVGGLTMDVASMVGSTTTSMLKSSMLCVLSRGVHCEGVLWRGVLWGVWVGVCFHCI